MTKHPERLTHLFKSPAQLRIARNFLERKLRECPHWASGDPAAYLEALAALDDEPVSLSAWCAEYLTSEQIRILQKALRLASNHQRVYKRTVMLSPRAHLLIKALSEQEGLKMSDVIERHLDGILRDRFGLTVQTSIDEHTGQVDHDVIPQPSPA
ncbi:hypothetical protein [Methylomagnum sp.]